MTNAKQDVECLSRDRPVTLGERLKCFGDRIREIDERLLDRLTGGQDLGFVENYIRGQFGIIVKLEGCREANRKFWAVSLHSGVGQVDDRTILRNRAEFAKLSDTHGRDEQSMFVDIVQLAD